jgi:hypothetical protein
VVAKGKEAIKELARTTNAVLYAGASLPMADGDALVEGGVQIFVGYGMCVFSRASPAFNIADIDHTSHSSDTRTEAGGCAVYSDFKMDLKNGNWQYLKFISGYNFTMLPAVEEGVKELVIAVGTLTIT